MLITVANPTNNAADPKDPVTKNGIKKLLAVIKIRQVMILDIDLDWPSSNINLSLSLRFQLT